MIERIVGCAFAALLVLAAPVSANESTVGCGEACDTKMEQCLDKCPKAPSTQVEVGEYDVTCRNECAKTVFHPCLDVCKDFVHKPSLAKD